MAKRRHYRPRRYARRMYHRARSFFTLSTIKKYIRLTAMVAPAARRVIQYKDTPERIPVWIVRDYTGFDMDDGSFDMMRALQGWGPILGFEAINAGVTIVKRLVKGR